MKTVLMAIAIIEQDGKVLLRKMDPAKNPYQEPWALFGGRLEGEGDTQTLMNVELNARWNMSIRITDRIAWDEEQKVDQDGEEKHFIYLDAKSVVVSGEPRSNNPNEELSWVPVAEVLAQDLNPPSRVILEKVYR